MKEFNSEHFVLKLHENGLKEVLVKRNHIFDKNDLLISKHYSDEFKPNSKFYVLMEGEEGATVNNEARRLVASPEYAQYTSALALCTSNLALRIMGNLFLKINKPAVATRLFETRQEALAWLHNHMEQQKQQ